MSKRLVWVTGFAALALLTACAPLALPAADTPTPFVVCTPPPCAANEAYHCPADCPGGCGTICATHTPEPNVTDFATVTATFAPVCTPPPCWSDETYFCAGGCPDGCGATCATRTPDPSAMPTPTFPATIGRCDLPSPQGSPALATCLSQDTIRVGEYAAVFAEATGIGTPTFTLSAQDDGGGYMRVELMPENRLRARDVFSNVLALDEVQAHETRAFFHFRALAPGAVTISLLAFGADFTRLEAAPIMITVAP